MMIAVRLAGRIRVPSAQRIRGIFKGNGCEIQIGRLAKKILFSGVSRSWLIIVT